MRKISHDSVSRFLSGRAYRNGNVVTAKGFYMLHGNTIASMDEHGTVFLRDCGWRTNVTKERLNAILELAGSPFRIIQRKHVWYIEDTRDWSLREWTGSFSLSVQ